MTPSRFSSCLALAWIFSALSLGPSALAQEPTPSPERDEDARLHFELGRRAYARADYETAVAEFEQSFALSARAELHYNLFLVYHELGREEDAARSLRAYLPHEDDPETRAHLEARLARIEAALAQPEAEPVIEDAAPLETLELGGEVVVEPPPASGDDGLTLGGATLLGLGGVTLLVTAITGGMAMGEHSALQMRCAPTCGESDVSAGRTLALTSDLTLGVGLALAATGAVLLLVDASSATETPLVTAWAGPSGGGVVATGRF